MSTQTICMDVSVSMSSLVIEIPPEEVLQLEAQISVVSPDQIELLEKIRQDSIDARDLSEQYSTESRHSANEAADSEIFARQYRDESQALNEDTRTLYNSTDALHSDTVVRHDDIVVRHDDVKALQASTEQLEQSASEHADRSESARDRAVTAETESSKSEAAALKSQQASKESELLAKESEQNSLDYSVDSENSATASEASNLSSLAHSEASKDSADASSVSAAESAASQAAAKESETNSHLYEMSADESRQAASGSASAALDSEEEADAHRIAAKASADSASSANQSAIAARDRSVEAETASELARDLARQWATEAEETPIEDGEYSALHWAKVAERIAGNLTNGMYFSGSWDLAEGFPPEPDEELAPWYRITNSDIESIKPPDTALEKLASQSNKGDQLVWDPIKKEWFVIDTSDEVWLVNGKRGEVVLNAHDVGAYKTQEIDNLVRATPAFPVSLLDTNINTLTGENPGIYYQHANSGSIPENGYPSERAGVLQVYKDSANGKRGCFQQYTEHRSGNSGGIVYIRWYSASGEIWSDWEKIYTTKDKPSPDDIGASPAGYGLGQSSLESIDSVDGLIEDNTGTGWFRATTDTPGNPTGGSGYAILHMAYNSASSHFIQLAFRQSSLADLYVRSHNSSELTDWFQFYTTRFKPTPSDIGALGNSGNQTISSGSLTVTDLYGRLTQKSGYQKLYRYSESEHGSPDFENGFLQSYVTFTEIEGACTWLFQVRSDELGSSTPQIPIELSLGGRRVYHQGYKPSPSDIGALADTGDQELTGALYPKVSEGSADNDPSSWASGYSLSAATGNGGYSANGTLKTNRAGAGRTSQMLAYPDSGISKLRFRVGDPEDDDWLPWAEAYSTQNKPTAADVGAVSLSGSQSISNCTSFTLQGGTDYSRIRLTNTNSNYGDDQGIAYLQAGFAEDSSGAQPGALRLTGWYGGFLKDCSIYIEEADALKVSVSGSWQHVYHTGYKPSASDVGAIPNTNDRLSSSFNIDDLYKENGVYECTQNNMDDPPLVGSWDATLLVLAGPNQTDQWLCPGDGSLFHRVDDGDPVTGKKWHEWRRIYSTRYPPTAAEVGAAGLTDTNIFTEYVSINPSTSTSFRAFRVYRDDSSGVSHQADYGSGLTKATITYRQDGTEKAYLSLGENSLIVRYGNSGNGRKVFTEYDPPTASDVGAEPTLATDRKRKITISTSDPSGGSDGDIWFKV